MSTLHITDGINPRVNSSHLREFMHKFVLLPCMVQWEDKELGMMDVTAADKAMVSVNTLRLEKQVLHDKSKFVEVLGQVYQPSFGEVTILAVRLTNLGENFDLDMANKVIRFTHDSHFRQIFNPHGSTANPILLSPGQPSTPQPSPPGNGLDNLSMPVPDANEV
ncbi:hypothetical protein BT96DRAFT_990815 [Gymnopus androsaceus JB14]|uniref:Uncharacterized protein n=1 Tax=Gymnopus androsaceus JB14 TaxID=1447944 RepID=A0A6A4I1N1_9AGAR|nr:hypothetical protein BT96DRAFT_990815 [Gymnopus androsaceus JB14]